MDVGSPDTEREIEVRPLREPVPAPAPVEEPSTVPAEEPAEPAPA